MCRLLPLLVLISLAGLTAAGDGEKLPLIFQDDFEKGADRWEPLDPKGWKVIDLKGNKV